MVLNEKKLYEIAKPYFETARAGDWDHAMRVVQWVKELGVGRDDLHLLIIAAAIHDIGWSGIAPKGKIDFDEMLQLEPQANMQSEKLAREVIEQLGFDEEEIKKVIRLIAAADEHASNSSDEAIVVDADNLSKLCVEHVTQKYQPDSRGKVIELWERELFDRIKTEKGKELFPKLLLDLKRDLIL